MDLSDIITSSDPEWSEDEEDYIDYDHYEVRINHAISYEDK